LLITRHARKSCRVSKPIEVTDRAILICHQRRRKHPSCARLAARRDAKNLERLERL